jgi:hypothetical protein
MTEDREWLDPVSRSTAVSTSLDRVMEVFTFMRLISYRLSYYVPTPGSTNKPPKYTPAPAPILPLPSIPNSPGCARDLQE